MLLSAGLSSVVGTSRGKDMKGRSLTKAGTPDGAWSRAMSGGGSKVGKTQEPS